MTSKQDLLKEITIRNDIRCGDAGYLTYRWEESLQGPPRKYYTLTEQGRTYLASLDEAWDTLVEQINTIRNKQ